LPGLVLRGLVSARVAAGPAAGPEVLRKPPVTPAIATGIFIAAAGITVPGITVPGITVASGPVVVIRPVSMEAITAAGPTIRAAV
jgi:hypothetical protein